MRVLRVCVCACVRVCGVVQALTVEDLTSGWPLKGLPDYGPSFLDKVSDTGMLSRICVCLSPGLPNNISPRHTESNTESPTLFLEIKVHNV